MRTAHVKASQLIVPYRSQDNNTIKQVLSPQAGVHAPPTTGAEAQQCMQQTAGGTNIKVYEHNAAYNTYRLALRLQATEPACCGTMHRKNTQCRHEYRVKQVANVACTCRLSGFLLTAERQTVGAATTHLLRHQHNTAAKADVTVIWLDPDVTKRQNNTSRQATPCGMTLLLRPRCTALQAVHSVS
jgi:hypothetical protein